MNEEVVNSRNWEMEIIEDDNVSITIYKIESERHHR